MIIEDEKMDSSEIYEIEIKKDKTMKIQMKPWKEQIRLKLMKKK